MKKIIIITIFTIFSLAIFGEEPDNGVSDDKNSEKIELNIPEVGSNAVPLNQKGDKIKQFKLEYDKRVEKLENDIKKLQEAEKKTTHKKSKLKKNLKPVTTVSQRVRSFFGIFFMLFLAFLISFNKKEIWRNSKRVIIGGLLIQFTFALFVMKIPVGSVVFKKMGDGVNKLLEFTHHGTKFVFGDLFEQWSFALKVLPIIIFFSAFMGVLYHLGIMQFVVKWIAKGMAKLLNTSGAESLSATANIFVGQTEAPLVIKPYINNMTNSEISAIMTGGFATVAGSVLGAYIGMGVDASSLIAASVMAAPGALVVAKIIYPEVDKPETLGVVEFDSEKSTANVIDAAARGASDGLYLALNVAAMLLAFLAIIYGLNFALKEITGIFLDNPISLEIVFGKVFSPIAWLMGVEWSDANLVGQLLGEKMVINEFYAFADLSNNIADKISDRSNIITAFALTGFANFASIAIQIGGIGTLAPKRKSDLAKIGFRAMLGGTIVALINGSIAGLLM